MKVKTGLDVLVERKFRKLSGMKIGVVANQASVTSELRHLIEELKKSRCQIEIVFTPEHGFTGAEEAGKKIYGEKVIEDYQVKAYSLYGESPEPPMKYLEEVDAIVFDLQDVGVRWYTYTSTLYYCIKACGKAGKPIYVLDRPNPIGGEVIEGPVLKSEFKSFIGVIEIPIRYGLTIGELANLMNEEHGLGAEVRVISMEGWKREYLFEDTGLQWVPPSPGMPTPKTALIYPGTALLEGTSISEGRGTALPFQLIGAPWINGRILAKHLNRQGLMGVLFRPAYFKPFKSKYAGELCRGVQIHVTNESDFRAFEVGVHILSAIKKLYPDKFEWLMINGKYYIDLLAGTDKLRQMIDEDEDPWNIVFELEKELEEFALKRERYLIYM